MEQETFVVAIEDLVDASDREAEGAPVVAEAIIYIREAQAFALAEANVFDV